MSALLDNVFAFDAEDVNDEAVEYPLRSPSTVRNLPYVLPRNPCLVGDSLQEPAVFLRFPESSRDNLALLLDGVNSHTRTFISARINVVKQKVSSTPLMSKPELSAKIRDLRRRLKMTQAGLAAQVGVSQVSVSRWESGQDEPSAAAYAQLARMAGPPECWFFWERIGIKMSDIYRAVPDMEESRYKPLDLRIEVLPARGALKQEGELKLKKRPDAVAVPLLHDPAAAGSPRMIEAAAVDRTVIADARDCPHPDATVCIRVRGESMSPILEDDYIVALDTFETDPKRLVNDMVAAGDPDGGVTIKWLRQVGDELMLIAQHTSPRFQPILLKREPGWKIIGRVLWWIGKPPK